jgi:hypothetical protein
MIFSIIHGIGADSSHPVDAGGHRTNGIVIDLLHRMLVDKEVDPVVTHVQGRRGIAVLDPVNTGNIFCPGILDLEAGRQHIRDDHIVDIRAVGLLQRQLHDHQIVLFKGVAGERSGIICQFSKQVKRI